MKSLPTEPSQSIVSSASRRRPLPALGLPAGKDSRRASGLASIFLHVLLVVLLLAPAATHTGDVVERAQGAGGLTAPGGGGGGRRGTGGAQERVRYVQVAPQPAPVVAKATVVPPVVQPTPTPKPVIPPPQVTPPVQAPTPEVKAEVKIEAKPAAPSAPVPGTGGGTGRDGSAGNGPGRGGGVGSGNGTGRGSGNGPGTGGGLEPNFPPTAIELFIPPFPMPDKVRGFHLVAEFDIDSTGKVLEYTFTPTRDGGYNRRLEEVLKGTKFRPGTTPDGKPIRMKAQLSYDF